MRFKKGLSNLEMEGQGRGIIMGVTSPLLLGPFYYIALYWVCNNMTNTVLRRLYNSGDLEMDQLGILALMTSYSNLLWKCGKINKPQM